MVGPITIKRAIKWAAGRIAVPTIPFVARPARPRASILVYHRIAEIGFIDPNLDDWNVPPKVFERQIAALASFAEIVPLPDLPSRLKAGSSKPLVCLTFDDGYANFLTQALPVLTRYQMPATIFVVTNCIGQAEPQPFDRWARRNRDRVSPEAWQPINWLELEGCLASGLVTIGSHSHRHLNGRECSPAQLREEAKESREILKRLKGQPRLYAYPYGSARLGQVSAGYVSAVKEAGYELAVTTDLALADSSSDPYLMPRIEVHALDSPAVLRAKAFGGLLPYHFIDRLRRARRDV